MRRPTNYEIECANFRVDPKTGKPLPEEPATDVAHEEFLLKKRIRNNESPERIEAQRARIEEAKRYEAEHPEEKDDWDD